MGELLKASLKLAESYKWLEELIPSTDDDIVKVLTLWTDKDKTSYLARNFELHLSDLSRLLDRCLAYRREYNELKASAIRQAVDYELFTDLYDSSLALERAAWMQGLRETEASGQGKAAEKFKKARVQLADGFSQLALTGEQVNTESAEAEKERIAFVEERWKILKRHQENLQLQHTEPGHPLNFKEQAERIRAFLLEDIAEAADKANAAYLGVGDILGVKPPDRDYLAAASDPLGNFVKWARQLMHDAEIALQAEIEVEDTVVIDLKGGLEGAFPFKPDSGTGVRIRSVGAALLLKDTDPKDGSLIVGDLRIWPPGRNRFHLNSVGMLQPNMSMRYYTGQAVANIAARKATDWKFELGGLRHTYKVDQVPTGQLRGVVFQIGYLYH